jgi:hypothetical protein
MGLPWTNGLGRCLHEDNPVLLTKTELYVRMRALNFGMSTLSGSVKVGCGRCRGSGQAQSNRAPDALSLAWRSTQRPRFRFHRKI